MRWNYKRGIALILTATVVLSSYVTPLDTRAASNISSGGGNPSGSGSFEGTLADVFQVVVPTLPGSINENQIYNTPYDFILDPKGLAANGSLAGKTLEPDATMYFENLEAGAQYNYSSTSDALAVINKSTIDVDVKLTAAITGLGGIKLAGDPSFPYDTRTSVYLALKDGDGQMSTVDEYGAAIKTTLKGRKDAYKVIWDAAANKYRYELKAPDILANENIEFEKYTFRLTGGCNPANSWTKVAGEVNANITVTWIVTPRPKNVAPSIEKTQYAMNKGCAITMGVDLGSGERAATGIEKITYRNSSGIVTTLPASNYTFTGGVLRLRPSYINTLIDGGISSRGYTIVFNDRGDTKAVFTLTSDDAGPSVAQTSYGMNSGQPVLVDVDLGSGTLGATGIKAITYTNSAGVTTTLPTDYYTLEAGTLRFEASYIDMLLNGGITARTHTIIFNDKNSTSVPITMKVDGTAPSIGKTDYTDIGRNENVEIDVDLGADSLAATGIKSITYQNRAGVTTTLSSDNYTFAAGILTLKASLINSLIDGGIASRAYTITFDNVVETKETITLSFVDQAPSIAKVDYEMVKDQPVLVENIDLGSGSSGATGIGSITYLNSKGVATTLSADYYTFGSGTLRFRPSYINTLLNGGIAARTYTIIFNDKNATSVPITMKVNGTAPSIAKTDYTNVGRNENVEIDVNLGTDSLEATGIKSITYQNSAGVTTTLSSDNYTFAAGILTLKASLINSLIDGGVASRAYTIIFDNVVGTKETATLTFVDKEPSITGDTFTMSKDKAILIDVDLGSGSKRATGIKSITYPNSAGVTTTLPTSYYTFEAGVLRLRPSYVNGVLDAGITSRKYTITLNDKSETTKAITFEAGGNAPSIDGAASYTMAKDKAVSITVNLGTDAYEATGVKSITYKNKSGVVTTLPTSNYTVENGVIRLRPSFINTLIDGGITLREYTIIFNNPMRTEAKFTLSK